MSRISEIRKQQNRLKKLAKRDGFNNHHIIPRARFHDLTDDEISRFISKPFLSNIPIGKHQNYHSLFNDRLPQEAIIALLCKSITPTLALIDFIDYQLIIDVLDGLDEFFGIHRYKPQKFVFENRELYNFKKKQFQTQLYKLFSWMIMGVWKFNLILPPEVFLKVTKLQKAIQTANKKITQLQNLMPKT